MKRETKNTLSLLAIPVSLLAVAVVIFASNGGVHKVHKAHKAHRAPTYAEAGVDLQREYGPVMKARGYEFTVRACLKDGKKYTCAALLGGGASGAQCAVIQFKDDGASPPVVTNLGAARDPTVCQ